MASRESERGKTKDAARGSLARALERQRARAGLSAKAISTPPAEPPRRGRLPEPAERPPRPPPEPVASPAEARRIPPVAERTTRAESSAPRAAARAAGATPPRSRLDDALTRQRRALESKGKPVAPPPRRDALGRRLRDAPPAPATRSAAAPDRAARAAPAPHETPSPRRAASTNRDVGTASAASRLEEALKRAGGAPRENRYARRSLIGSNASANAPVSPRPTRASNGPPAPPQAQSSTKPPRTSEAPPRGRQPGEAAPEKPRGDTPAPLDGGMGELAEVTVAWPTLTRTKRASILSIIRDGRKKT